MVLFNHATREMTAKIVYYGPGLCGKTTNLLVIFDKLDPKTKGKMLSLATKTDRTLFFDLLPVDIGRIGNFNLKIQLYTVPGQVFYNETRKLVLKGADSIVFVADSQPTMVESNRESFANLMENLEQNQLDPNDIPIVIQYNKRDLPGVMPVEELQAELGLDGYPYAEASALRGDGVMETFKLVTKITAKHLIAKLSGKSGFESKRIVKKASNKISETDSGSVPALAESPGVTETPSMPPVNPFADSVPIEPAEGYERAEEVSLEQLLDGRDRPATISGNVPIPLSDGREEEDIEELDAADIIEDDPIEVTSFSPEVEEAESGPGTAPDFAPGIEPETGAEPQPDQPALLDAVSLEIEEPLPTMDELREPESDEGRIAELEDEVHTLRSEIARLESEHAQLRNSIAQNIAEIARLLQK